MKNRQTAQEQFGSLRNFIESAYDAFVEYNSSHIGEGGEFTHLLGYLGARSDTYNYNGKSETIYYFDWNQESHKALVESFGEHFYEDVRLSGELDVYCSICESVYGFGESCDCEDSEMLEVDKDKFTDSLYDIGVTASNIETYMSIEEVLDAIGDFLSIESDVFLGVIELISRYEKCDTNIERFQWLNMVLSFEHHGGYILDDYMSGFDKYDEAHSEHFVVDPYSADSTTGTTLRWWVIDSIREHSIESQFTREHVAGYLGF